MSFDKNRYIEIAPLVREAKTLIVEKYFKDNKKLKLSDNFFSVTYVEAKKVNMNTKDISNYAQQKQSN